MTKKRHGRNASLKKSRQHIKRFVGGVPRAFTIIEVLIVLAIAGFILLVVFLAIPAANRNARNYDRKQYAGLLSASLNQYYSDFGRYPGTLNTGTPSASVNETEICNFLQSLPRVKSGATCAASTAGGANCVGAIQAGAYTVCYQDWDLTPHSFIGQDDEISIMLAHWCNIGSGIDPSQPSDWPVAGNDTNVLRYVIWTPMEGSAPILCIDNFPKNLGP